MNNVTIVVMSHMWSDE